jgi:hypothetical protein
MQAHRSPPDTAAAAEVAAAVRFQMMIAPSTPVTGMAESKKSFINVLLKFVSYRIRCHIPTASCEHVARR